MQADSAFAWSDEATAIRSRIVPPTFADNALRITETGAKPGKGQNVGPQIKQAIEQVAAAGGGKVVVPPGEFYTGPIHLLSNINLHIEEGATLTPRREW